MAQIFYEYFKKELKEATVLVRINPENFAGLELIVLANGQIKKTKRSFDETIYEDLEFDAFIKSSPLEFNLYLNGISS